MMVALTSVIGQSVPVFFLAIVLVLVFSATFQVLPAFGFESAGSLVLPAVSVAMLPLARIARLSRASMRQILHREFIVTAQSKGLSWAVIIWRHGLKNAMLPILTLVGYDLVQIFGSQTVAEVVFTWPGLGSQLIRSAGERDYPVVMAIACVVTVVAVTVTLLVDLAYEVFDPRIREAA
jgi:peptide/nickel transport system permease protein